MVITIIGLLVGLLLPAINAAREAARQVTCLNKMSELAKAVQIFEENQKRYPGWWEWPWQAFNSSGQPLRDPAGNPIHPPVSWVVPLLPHLQRDDVYETWRTPTLVGSQWVGSRVPLHDKLVCPSDTVAMTSQQPEISYVANCGTADVTGPNSNGPDDWRTNGIFLNLNRNFDPQVETTSAAYVMKYDGLSNTLLLSENLDATLWWRVNENENGFLFWEPGRVPLGVHINGSGPVPPPYTLARPSSNHRGGVNVVFAGGNTRFLHDSISYGVYCALMTPNGPKAVLPGTQSAPWTTVRNQTSTGSSFPF